MIKTYKKIIICLFVVLHVYIYVSVANAYPSLDKSFSTFSKTMHTSLTVSEFVEEYNEAIFIPDVPNRLDESKTLISYMTKDFKHCIPGKNEVCVNLNDFRSKHQHILIGNKVYNELSDYEKAHNFVYLDTKEPFQIYQIIGNKNKSSILDNLFLKSDAYTGNANEEVLLTVLSTNTMRDRQGEKLQQIEAFTNFSNSRISFFFESFGILIFCITIVNICMINYSLQMKKRHMTIQYILGATKQMIYRSNILEMMQMAIIISTISIMLHVAILKIFPFRFYVSNSSAWCYSVCFGITFLILLGSFQFAIKQINFKEIEVKD